MSEARLRFTGTDDGLQAQFKKANASLDSLERGAARTNALLGKGFSAVSGIIAGLSFLRVAGELFEFNENLLKSASTADVTVESMQRLQFIADQSETSVESITSSIVKFHTLLGQGNDKTIASLHRLGISLEEINSSSPDQQFLRIAKSLASIQSPAEQDALSINLFGKGFKEMLPLLRLGADGIDKVDAQFDELGITLSGKTVKAVDDAGDAIGRMGSAVKALGVEILSLPAPAIEFAADKITLFFKAVAFGLRGTGGGHGENEIANITRDIELAKDEVDRLRNGVEKGGIFGPAAGRELIEVQARLDGLITRLETLSGLGAGGINPLRKLGVDVDAIGVSAAAKKGLGNIDLGPENDSAQEKRLRQQSQGNEVAARAKDDNELLLQLNQEKLDKLLEQETKGIQDRAAVAVQGSNLYVDIAHELSQQLIDIDRFKNDFMVDANKATAGLLVDTLNQVFGQNKNYQIAMATISTLAGAARALSEFPYPYSIAIAGLVLAQGFARVRQIKSVSHRDGGTGSFAGGGAGGGSVAGGAVSAPQPATGADADPSTGRALQVYLNGPISGPDSAKWLIDQLRDLMNNRDVVVINPTSTQAQLIRGGR